MKFYNSRATHIHSKQASNLLLLVYMIFASSLAWQELAGALKEWSGKVKADDFCQSINQNKYISLSNKKYSNSLLQCYHESLSKCHINLQVAEYFYKALSSSIITIFNTYITTTYNITQKL